MNRKSILFLSSWYPTVNSPTNGDFVKRHAQAAAIYNNVIIVHIDIADHEEVIINPGKNLTEIIYYYKSKGFPVLTKFLRYRRAIQSLQRNGFSPDLIHGNVLYPMGLYVYILSKTLRIPFVFSEHWTGYLKEDPSKLNALKMMLVKFISKRCSFLLPVSSYLEKGMKDENISGNYKVIPNVVDDELFNTASSSRINNKIPFTHISNLNDKHKNISGIFRAIKKLKETRNDFLLQIINSEENPSIKNLAKELEIEDCIVFLGRKEHRDVAKLLSESAFTLMFSNFETQGCVILESLMSGTPVITTKTGGIEDFVNEQNGLFADIGNSEQLCQKMDEMLNRFHSFSKSDIRNNIINKVSPSKIGEMFDEVYNQTLKL